MQRCGMSFSKPGTSHDAQHGRWLGVWQGSTVVLAAALQTGFAASAAYGAFAAAPATTQCALATRALLEAAARAVRAGVCAVAGGRGDAYEDAFNTFVD